MPTNEPEIPFIEQTSITIESHLVDAKSQSTIELQLDVKFQIDHVELPNKEVHGDIEVEKIIEEERRTEPRLSRYVIRNHHTKQIIGERNARPMTRRSSRGGRCLVSKIKPSI